MSPKIVIGITGGFGTGKTTVARMLGAKGAKILDADKIAHAALKRNSDTYGKIKTYFGRAVLKKDGSINRKKLAELAFTDRRKTTTLNSIVHPFVIKKIKSCMRKAGKKSVIVIDAPLLIEAGLAGIVDKLVVVKTTPKIQLARCIKRKFKKGEALSRIKIQMPLKKKVRMADFVIDNNGSLIKTKKEVEKLWKIMTR